MIHNGAELEHALERLDSEADRALRAVRALLVEDSRGIAAAN